MTHVVVREVAAGADTAKMVPLPKSTEELVSRADIIAVGRVGKVIRVVAEGGLKEPVVKQTLVPHTYFELELEQIIRDDGTIGRGETVILREEGNGGVGPVEVGEGTFMEWERSSTTPETGQRRLFVLVKTRNDSYGGGRSGLLDIDGDVVRWASNDQPVGFAIGKTPEEFVEEVTELVGVDGPELPTNTHFPQQHEGVNIVMEAELEGQLVSKDGCLRITSIGGTDYLLIWPHGFKLTVDGRNIQVSDDSGVSLSVGEEIRIGGGEVSLSRVQAFVEQPLPSDCPGPYWVAGEVPLP